LIDAEVPSGKRHDDMVASFNRGYRGFQSYRACTSVVDVVIRRYLEDVPAVLAAWYLALHS